MSKALNQSLLGFAVVVCCGWVWWQQQYDLCCQPENEVAAKSTNSMIEVGYHRDNWSFISSTSPVANSELGWYTEIYGSATDVDHVVALKDAYLSGGHVWSSQEKQVFANDSLNHVAAVPYVNRTLKNAYVPVKYIGKLQSSNYTFASGKCSEYINLYVKVKIKYGLTFKNNRIDDAMDMCGRLAPL